MTVPLEYRVSSKKRTCVSCARDACDFSAEKTTASGPCEQADTDEPRKPLPSRPSAEPDVSAHCHAARCNPFVCQSAGDDIRKSKSPGSILAAGDRTQIKLPHGVMRQRKRPGRWVGRTCGNFAGNQDKPRRKPVRYH